MKNFLILSLRDVSDILSRIKFLSKDLYILHHSTEIIGEGMAKRQNFNRDQSKNPVEHHIDLEDFVNLSIPTIRVVGEYQKANCGKVTEFHKKPSAEIEDSLIHSCFSHVDIYSQDSILVPLFLKYPFMRPLAEEDTEIRKKYMENESDYTFLLDPLDYSATYLAGGSDYSLMQGLIHNGSMVAGIGFYAEKGEFYVTIKGKGAWKIDKDGKTKHMKKLDQFQYDAKKVAGHYRLDLSPFDKMKDNLIKHGYDLATNESMQLRDIPEGRFGTNLTGILKVAKGERCAFIGPNMSLHDFAVPALIVEELGGVVRLFDYEHGKDNIMKWKAKEKTYDNLRISEENRYRVIIADSEHTINRIVENITKIPDIHQNI